MKTFLLGIVAALALMLAGSGRVKADDFTLSLGYGLTPYYGTPTEFYASGSVGSAWVGHAGTGSMGTYFGWYSYVTVHTGISAKFHFTRFYKVDAWNEYNDGSFVTSAVSVGLNPENSDPIDWNTDFDVPFGIEISMNYGNWFHNVLPDTSTYRYQLDAVEYQITQSAEIHMVDWFDDTVVSPPGTVVATPTTWTYF